MRLISLVLIGIFLFGCSGGGDTPPALLPELALLIHPEDDSECTTGQELSTTTSEVEFRWQAAENTEIYELRATNLNTNTTQTISTASTSAKLPLEKGALYSWQITSKNAAVLQSTPSETWRFYNSGFQTTYAPFPAEIVAPKVGASVVKDGNNDVTLRWTGADIDNDIQEFEIYVSTENPPETLIFSAGSGATTTKTAVVANTVYYWRIVTKDSEGNSSDSGVFDFRAL